MKKFLKSKSKLAKLPTPETASSSSSSSPGYQLKDKDLPKLHKAAWNGDLAKLQQLSKKTDVYTLDKQNRTPLHLACAQGHVNIVNFLTTNTQGSKLNLGDNDQRSALMKAVQGDFDDCVEILIHRKADPNLVDRDGNTALHLAAQYGFVQVAILLLNSGAMANPTNKIGSTPLHQATAGRHDEMVELLLEGNADVNATDKDNRTALMLACQTDQIGTVKILLDSKADTDIKDSKGWTANDHAIMEGFHGCSHLIDEFNASCHPKSAMGRPGSAGMFGSTTGSDALGFSIGGPAADHLDDDDDELLSYEKGSMVDSWTASETEELPKSKTKAKKPANLSKFVHESDNESIKSKVSLRSSNSRSRIPVSRQESLTSQKSLQSARGKTSSSKLPCPAQSSGDTQDTKMANKQERTQGKPKRKDSVDSAPPTPSDSKGVTPRESFVPTPRGSILSALDTGSEWDDEDVLEGTEAVPKQPTKVKEQKENTPRKGKAMEKEELATNHNRKEVLEGLGLSRSDFEDESTVVFSDEENQNDDIGAIKQTIQASGDNLTTNEQKNNNHETPQMPPPAEDEDDGSDSDWDSVGEDLLPSDTDNKGPPVVRPGALSRGNQSEDDTKQSPSLSRQYPQKDTQPAKRQPIVDPPIKAHVIMEEESPVHLKRAVDKIDSPEASGHSRDKNGDRDNADEEGEEDWDSDEEDVEEESEWERERDNTKERLGDKLQNPGQPEELIRQKQGEQEERQQQEKLRQAEEELRIEKEEREHEWRDQEEANRQQLEKEKAAEKRRNEEMMASEEDMRRQQKADERKMRKEADESRREEEAEVERKRAEIEVEQKNFEELRRQEEDRIQAARKQLEKERMEQEKRNDEQRKIEAVRKREEEKQEAERRRLEELTRQAALQRSEEQNKVEQAFKEEEQRVEAGIKRLEEQRQQEQQRQKAQELEREKERKHQESERRRLDEEKREFEEHRQRIEDEKKQLEQERKLEMERKKIEDERRKREEERLQTERKKHEEMKRQFEEDQLKRTLQLKDEDEAQRAMERKHLEDERRRLEEQKLETDRRERDMEEQQIREKHQLMSTQKELDEMKRRMEDDRARLEQQFKETSQQRQEADRRAVEAEKELFEKAKKQEQDMLTAEKERLEAENQEIEKKRLEILEMQKQLEKTDTEETLQKYQESIEKQLADESRSVNCLEDDESQEDIARDLEAAVAQRQQIESGIYSAGIHGNAHTTKANNKPDGMQSMGNTAEFSLASFCQGIPMSSTRRQSDSRPSPVSTNAIARSPIQALYSPSPVQHFTSGHNTFVPTWQTVLSEPDGLDYTSSEGEEDMMATRDGLHSSMRSPHLTHPTPVHQTLGSPGSFISPSTNDPAAILRLQGMVREQKRAAERERNERLNASNQCRLLNAEKAEILKRLDDVTKFKTSLDQQMLDLEAKIRGLEHELSQELERRHNSEVLLQKTKEQLIRKEELYSSEIEAKQKTELNSRNLQLNLRSAKSMLKQFEEERIELRRQLAQEKAVRAIQEGMVNDQRMTQETLQEESSRFYTEKAEAVSRLEAADETRKAALNQSDKLKTELYALKLQLNKQKMRHRDDQGLLVSENEELSGKIEQLKNEIRVSEEALAHATMTYNAQLTAVRTENAMLHNSVEKDKHTKEQLKAQLESMQKRLETTNMDLERAEKTRSELEHTLQRDCGEWNRARERIEHENTTMKESTQVTAERLGAAESRVASLENELQAANTSLMERTNQLAGLQRDMDMRSTMQTSHESLLHKEREDNVKLQLRVETLTERLTEAHTEIGSLKRSLDAAQHQHQAKDKDTHTAQEKFNNTLTSLQAESDRTRTIWEERNHSLQESISRLKEELQRAEHNSSIKDQDVRKLQQELTDSLLKVSITENHLEMASKTKGELERKKENSKDHIKQLTDKVSSLEKERRSLESRVDELQNQLVYAERNNLDTSHQLITTQTTLQKKADVEDEIRQLEKENNRLEMCLKQETNQSLDLARKLEESQKMCHGLETMITNIKTSQLVMEDKLSEATVAKSLFAREVDDHKVLWESEVKSRSKLGLKIAQLERAKADVQTQVDEEKKKTRKIAEMKRNAEDKWQNEVQRTEQLEQDNATLRAKVKLAKKKLKDQSPPELRLSTMQTDFERERLNMEAAMATIRRQLEDVNQQLDRESMLRMGVEKANRQLQQEVNSSKTSEKTKDKLEKSKRRLEDELAQIKHALENGYIEKGHLEKYKQEVDAKARMEINEKLEQVNIYLEEQSQARENLEKLRFANEAEIRKELEDTIEDLKFQLSRVRNGYHDAQTRKDTMEAETSKFKEMHNHEVQRREKLAADLEKTQDKLLEAQAKLNFERQKNRHLRDGSYNMSTDIPASMTPSKMRNMSPRDSIAEKVWSELDKSISRHLQAAPTDIGQNFSDFRSDRLNNSYGTTSPRSQDNGYQSTLRKNYYV